MKIHILGPSGSGTTTLGQLLAERLDHPFFDNDDFFWEDTEIPFSKVRPKEGRSALLHKTLEDNSRWIISGAADGWGDLLLEEADLIILLYTDKDVRLKRLRDREEKLFGERIQPGGDMHKNHQDFIDWAGRYDEAGMEQRSRVKLESWVERAKGKVLYFYNEEVRSICDLVIDLYS